MRQPWLKMGLVWGWTLTCVLTLTALLAANILCSGRPLDFFRCLAPCAAREYFLTSVGPIKRVDISYGPNSVSRGIANITFREADGASKAFQKLNGLLVDNRPIKIEIVVGASQAANVIPPAKKTLAERTTQPKAQPKSAANNKRNNANAGKGGPAAAGTGGKKPRAKRTGRPAKKTAEELDSEMADYFESGANPNENAASAAPAPAATNGDAAMEDEIM
ncbi:RNA recognition domain-containing protein [Colletotrichum orchidophilum]|uniref:RNA recognition domain-containing protein n=1 Tax=Colletotrichum orchidophilum TaxID=1209926 RepID=A0A1G4BD10_9PEZI|nr:RNA recognition domain-containing protein [Colletotrichum orchidophilum]OHE99225.1 RNA recognition domain-containing protein [Colletotrichum orchidophilum]